ncbi:hypothetical protein [Streptomyces tremellae]|uniref:AB hydrolase-1 domain-containing protein n=1 Tax=Streptomyces tremellae TaxID=1124239 RepID=A0ABP7F787_9ACTN
MTAVLFVHGTGVRQKAFDATLDVMTRSLLARRPDLTVEGCFWGDAHGSRLFAGGASVPVADEVRDAEAGGGPEEADVMVWESLQEDPLFELRLLAAADAPQDRGGGFHPGRQPRGRALEEQYGRFAASGTAESLFREAGLGGEFARSCRTVAASRPFGDLGDGGVAPRDAWPVLVRATVAEALRGVERAGGPGLRAVYDREFRDEFLRAVTAATGEEYRDVLGRARQRVGTFFAGRTTSYVSRRRDAFTATASSVAGDILLYQRDGSAVRRFVADHIDRLEPPVVVVAHSLGGIICADLFATAPRPEARLVTVGTAAPLFWELDALWGLRAGAPLPTGFPPWTNIYDRRDFLAYVAAPLFGGRVRDIRVDNGQPFPRCHSAYWWNGACWDAVLSACP